MELLGGEVLTTVPHDMVQGRLADFVCEFLMMWSGERISPDCGSVGNVYEGIRDRS